MIQKTQSQGMPHMGILQRILHVLAGAALFSLGFLTESAWQYLAIAGPFLILFGVLGISPVAVIIWLLHRQ